MANKVPYLVIFVILSILFWIYRSSNVEFQNTVYILQQNHIYLRKALITPSACKESSKLIIIVTSYVGHIELRSAHRRALSSNYLKSKNTTRIFLLAKIPGNEKFITQAAIEDESNIYGDILQGSFYENYRNLTFKHLMGLQYASTQCGPTSYILKVDDDTIFNFELTYNLISTLSYTPNGEFIMGYILNNTLPRRNKQNKWYVTQEEYPFQKYPPYLSGWYYIINPKTAALIANEALYHPYFWIDDILVTGILTEYLNIKLKQLPNDYWLEYYELLECCLRDMVMRHIECEYVVGPNGGRNNLIVEFNKAYEKCKGTCTKRTALQTLKSTCIMNRDRTIFSDGQAEVYSIKL